MEFWILIALVVAIGLFAVISKQSTDKKLEESDQKYAPRGELDERIKSLDTDFNILKRSVDTLKSETDRFNAAQEKISRLESVEASSSRMTSKVFTRESNAKCRPRSHPRPRRTTR